MVLTVVVRTVRFLGYKGDMITSIWYHSVQKGKAKTNQSSKKFFFPIQSFKKSIVQEILKCMYFIITTFKINVVVFWGFFYRKPLFCSYKYKVTIFVLYLNLFETIHRFINGQNR